ncbi:MAG: FecR domain-containing protein [Alistipes senegalensis]|nr:FecR domain-containing protein [Bacteroides cellulosilyticus]MCM1352918.1 FecR domain-containing protein [Alistipes senegalensis]
MEDTNDKVLNKLLDGTITESDVQHLVSLLDTPSGRAMMSEQMDAVLDRAEMHAGNRIVDKRLEAVCRRIERRIRSHRIRCYVLRTAAVVVPLLVVAAVCFIGQRQIRLFAPSEYAEIATAKGERTQVVFQDGTKVYLNADSRLRYPVRFGLWNRKIYLDGEAYFKVGTNKYRPFIVEFDRASVRVTGTSFDVRAYSNNPIVSVTLDEGHVDLVTENNTYPLQPSEQIVYNRSDERIAIVKHTSPQRLSSWKDNVIAFDKAPLEEVLRTLDRWYDVEFRATDPRVYRYSYTFTSDFVPLEVLLKDLELLAPVKFRRKENHIEVYVK